MEISKRLQAVANAVTPGNRIADVGTDHGYIPIYLVKNQICPGGIAMDIRKGPLGIAREHIRDEKLEKKIGTRLGDGLRQVEPDEVDTVVIAGMGGSLICQILDARPEFFAKGKEFVLQPQSEWFKVRRLLARYHYEILQEWFVKEEGKYYVVLKAVPAPKETMFQKEEKNREGSVGQTLYEQYGEYLIKEKHPLLKEYLEKEMAKKEEIVETLQQSLPQMPDEERATSEKERENIQKRQERSQELIKEIKEIQTCLREQFDNDPPSGI